MNKKTYIAIEGVSGVGKTTVVDRLKKKYTDTFFIKEPQDFTPNKKNKLHEQYITNQLIILGLAHNFYATHDSNRHVITDRSWISGMCYFPPKPTGMRYKFMSLSNSIMSTTLKEYQVLVILLMANKEIIRQRTTTETPDYVYKQYDEIENIFGEINVVDAEQAIDKVYQDVEEVVAAIRSS